MTNKKLNYPAIAKEMAILTGAVATGLSRGRKDAQEFVRQLVALAVVEGQLDAASLLVQGDFGRDRGVGGESGHVGHA